MDLLIYCANLLYLGAYFVQDMLRLRLLSLAAACCLVGYFATRSEILVPVICWNLVFAALNAFQIARLVRRHGVSGADEAGSSRNTSVETEIHTDNKSTSMEIVELPGRFNL